MFSPTTFDKYFLTRRIAVGGMAEVYQAKLYGADGFEKDLVIKQILPQHAQDPQFVRSFVAEAKIAVGLSHPNIVGVYELGKAEGTYFIAMEYVDGLDALQLLRAANAEDPVPIAAAIRIAWEIARGLEYAHAATAPDGKRLGLVHRDLNPRNILVSKRGDVKILDFGIAKVEAEHLAVPRTRAGVVKGTLGYMAPEQAAGHSVDARTDIYQCAVVLWELLTGEHLFWRSDDRDIQDNFDRHVIAKPSQLRAGVSEALDAVLQASLTREPKDRTGSAGELAESLRDILKSEFADYRQADLAEYVQRIDARLEVERLQDVENLPETPSVAALITRPVTRKVLPEPSAADALAADAPAADAPATDAPAPIAASPESSAALTHPEDAAPAVSPASSRSWAWVVLALAAFGGLAVWMWPAPRPDTARVEADAGPAAPADLGARLPVVATATKSKPPPPGQPPPPTKGPPPTKRVVRTQTPPPPAAAKVEFADVDLGTRSCSARVLVDGKLLARITPSFNHRLPAGAHRFTFEGVGCAAGESAGSLGRRVPVLSRRLQLPPGKAQIIADFAQERLLLRPRPKE